MSQALTRRVERLERDLMPERSAPYFVMASDAAAAKHEIVRLKADFGERLPKTLFVMILAARQDRDH